MLTITMRNGEFSIREKGVATCLVFNGQQFCYGTTPSLLQFVQGRKFLAKFKRHCYAVQKIGNYKTLLRLVTNVTAPQWEELAKEWESLSAPIMQVVENVKKRVETYHRTIGFQAKNYFTHANVYSSIVNVSIYPGAHHGATDGSWTIGNGMWINNCTAVVDCYGNVTTLAKAIESGRIGKSDDCTPVAVKHFIKIAKEMIADNGEQLYQACLLWYINQSK